MAPSECDVWFSQSSRKLKQKKIWYRANRIAGISIWVAIAFGIALEFAIPMLRRRPVGHIVAVLHPDQHIGRRKRMDRVSDSDQANAFVNRKKLLARSSIVATFAAGFLLKNNFADGDALIERFAHIVNRQRRDGGGGHRFHLHAGFS